MPAGQHHLSSSLHLCPDQCAAKLLLIFIFEVNTMAISLSCHWSSTVSSLFTSIFFFWKLFYSLKVLTIISKALPPTPHPLFFGVILAHVFTLQALCSISFTVLPGYQYHLAISFIAKEIQSKIIRHEAMLGQQRTEQTQALPMC